MPSHQDRSHLPGRQRSPFTLDQIIALRRADLFEKVLIGRITDFLERAHSRPKGLWIESDFAQPYDPDSAKSFSLASAILFGALLDRRGWDQFYRVACMPVVDFRTSPHVWLTAERPIRIADRIWLNLLLSEEAGKVCRRRWVADPLTHFLLLRFQSVGRQTATMAREAIERILKSDEDANPCHQNCTPNSDRQSRRGDETTNLRSDNEPRPDHVAFLARAFGVSGWDYEQQSALVEGLFAAAVIKWRTRMPGFLLENLLEQGKDEKHQSTSLPETHWERLVGTRAKPLMNFEKKGLVPKRQSRSRDPILRLIDELLPASRASAPREFGHAAEALSKASRRNDVSPVERHVLAWAAARLDPSVDPVQQKRRLAPSTVRKRASALLSVLRLAFGEEDPWRYEPAKVAEALMAVVGTKEAHSEIWNHLECFLDWQSRTVRAFALTVVDRSGRRASSAKACIVTRDEYAMILSRFDPHKQEGRMARILVILGFRAGLRWEEAIHLNIADITFSGSCAELQVRDNRERRTKTPASRRVLPLHVLLEQTELEELKTWWCHRYAEVKVLAVRMEQKHGLRLFPRADDDFDARLKRDIEHEIRKATGDVTEVFHVLRHSFASYLIATLALPFDVSDEELVLPIDRSVVSHERRAKISCALQGAGRLGQNAVHVAGALLGHSGESSTLKTYFHLHDWLAGNYVSRPEAMRAVPTKLAARLLDMSEGAVARAASRNRCANASDGTIRRKRGRPRRSDHTLGAIKLRDFIEKGELVFGETNSLSPLKSLLPSAGELSLQALEGFMLASDPAERELIVQAAGLNAPNGKRLMEELESILAITTKGRRGEPVVRFAEMKVENRQRSVRQLTEHERIVLSRLYGGLRRIDPHAMGLIRENFLKGYDRLRGNVSVPRSDRDAIIEAFLAAGLSPQEIKVQDRARTSLIRLETGGRMHRGYVWAVVFACAAHQASSAEGGRQDRQCLLTGRSAERRHG